MPNPTINKLAEYLYQHSGAEGMLFITTNPSDVDEISGDIPLYLLKTPLLLFKRKIMGGNWPINCKLITKTQANKSFVHNKVTVYRNGLGKYSLGRTILLNESLLSICMGGNGPSPKLHATLHGSVSSPKQPNIKLTIGGRLSNTNVSLAKPVRLLTFIPVYNEADIIIQTLNHLLSQGSDICVLDNWSDDGSYETVLEFSKKFPKRVTVQRFPEKPNNAFELQKIMRKIEQLSVELSGSYDWFMVNDADEIRWSPWPGITLGQAMSFISRVGFNSVAFTLFNFELVKDGFGPKDDPKKFFEYGEFVGDEFAFLQVKAWRSSQKIGLAKSGGHLAEIPDQNIFPIKFLLCHYPLRSTEQAGRKIFKERLPRYTTKEKKIGWHVHYNNQVKNQDFIKSKDGLIRFDQTDFYRDYLIQRISGIGISDKIEV